MMLGPDYFWVFWGMDLEALQEQYLTQVKTVRSKRQASMFRHHDGLSQLAVAEVNILPFFLFL
jgi:hypothetical protein